MRVCGAFPVSPKFVSPFLKVGCKKPNCKGCPADKGDVEQEEIGPEDIDYGNHIIGKNVSQPDVKPLVSPRELTPVEWAEHVITHLPYCSSCPHCLAGKRNHCPTAGQRLRESFRILWQITASSKIQSRMTLCRFWLCTSDHSVSSLPPWWIQTALTNHWSRD